ncbi:phosphatidylethanolamine N-methyltransferas-like protein [Lineolata rhizophorae]|uniref:Phosphatidylethanolamine N-methyltransferase n=1 Tax=Lineolata rhizophorae TaxID=578093 RepID=A0A6A6P6G9_9PEZI|nr:phosphatidylethanolamine N-methyltransferas-like protein [Lineolata rhizophorae]
MSSAHDQDAAVDAPGLRERLPQHPDRPLKAESTDEAKRAVEDLNRAQGRDDVPEKERKTFGRTPDGTVFTVPQTHDMVSQLLSPSQPKNYSDLFVLAVLAFHILTLWALPPSFRQPVFAIVFLFWRACYNAGIGWLLHAQSQGRLLVSWAKRSKIFENPAKGNNKHPKLYALLKREMETKIPKDYKFEDAPIEYNTWLLFRRIVDLILMCDFVSYFMFAFACFNTPAGEGIAMTVARWAAGIALFLFNLWVKLDAHRVVKDFAWYWGDFFYLIDQELTFDGVFEMAPHPMYSVGYAGYYGISLMAASYKVLFISIVAHAAQFAFLTIVENPHIEKTYNPPALPRKRASISGDAVNGNQESDRPGSRNSDAPYAADYPSLGSATQPSPVHHLLGLQNIDLHRVTDVSVFLLQLYTFMLATLTPSSTFYQTIFVANAAIWRLWYSLGVGYILDRQSNKKNWTRHFIKYGEDTEEAWRQWKGLYHLSMTMCYASFIAAAYKMYSLPPDWEYGMALLRHVLGVALISLQIWTAVSIYESLGEFGWFYGDFFFDHAPKLTYNGIYRFLNNPERVLGLAGVWGFALITWSKAIFFVALLAHLLTLAFIQFVERPHMQKLYGEALRGDSGISKTIKRSLPGPIRQWHGNVDRVVNETVDSIEEFIETTRPKLAAGVQTIVRDSTALFKHYPARFGITRLARDLGGLDPKDYSLSIEGTTSAGEGAAMRDKSSGREGENARRPPQRTSEFRTLIFEYGAPIKVRWTAPANHAARDWIGLYMVSDNASREATRVSSQGRWIATTRGAYDNARADQGILVSSHRVAGTDRAAGEMEFAGDKLWWTTGVFEFRYHHDGMHNVMAISLPFEVRIGRFDEDDAEPDANGQVRGAVEQALLPVVRNCFDRDPEIAPRTVEEPFGRLEERDGKFAKRVVFAVHQMFGIEFAPEVVQADGNVKNLAWRICNAKKVLVSDSE